MVSKIFAAMFFSQRASLLYPTLLSLKRFFGESSSCEQLIIDFESVFTLVFFFRKLVNCTYFALLVSVGKHWREKIEKKFICGESLSGYTFLIFANACSFLLDFLNSLLTKTQFVLFMDALI